jgi:hypothetical protein
VVVVGVLDDELVEGLGTMLVEGLGTMLAVGFVGTTDGIPIDILYESDIPLVLINVMNN